MDIGSSYLPSDMIAAFLWAQISKAKEITSRRMEVWNNYHNNLEDLENHGKFLDPIYPIIVSIMHICIIFFWNQVKKEMK